MSNIFDYKDPIITRLRKGSSDDPLIDKTDTLQIDRGTVVLTEIPDEFHRVKVSGASITWTETKGISPSENQYKVDYINKIIYFHSSRNGLQLTFKYKGRGLIYVPASMIYTQESNGSVTETLQEFITAGQEALDTLADVNEAIIQVKEATQDAINATLDLGKIKETIKVDDMDARNLSDMMWTFDTGKITYTPISAAHAVNQDFPEGKAGMLITDKVYWEEGFQRQKYKIRNEITEYDRFTDINGNWSNWHKLYFYTITFKTSWQEILDYNISWEQLNQRTWDELIS